MRSSGRHEEETDQRSPETAAHRARRGDVTCPFSVHFFRAISRVGWFDDITSVCAIDRGRDEEATEAYPER